MRGMRASAWYSVAKNVIACRFLCLAPLLYSGFFLLALPSSASPLRDWDSLFNRLSDINGGRSVNIDQLSSSSHCPPCIKLFLIALFLRSISHSYRLSVSKSSEQEFDFTNTSKHRFIDSLDTFVSGWPSHYPSSVYSCPG
jgi:hypothetical protein